MHSFAPSTPAPGPFEDPIAEYPHPGVVSPNPPVTGISITGGFVYRGSAIPDLIGKYIFGDWSNTSAEPGNGRLLGLEETAPDVWGPVTALNIEGLSQGFLGKFITAFGRDEDGELYVVARSSLDHIFDANPSFPSGVIYKIVAVPEPATWLLLASAGVLLLIRSRFLHHH